MRKRSSLLPLVLLGLALAAALVALSSPIQTRIVLAQQPTPSDDQVNAIARQLYCPVCENVPLDVCPTQACAQWRATIRDKLAQGWSEQQIKDYFVQQYGVRVLATPPARGLNLLVYILPPLAFAAGTYILYRAIRSGRARAPAESQAAPPSIDDEYARRLEEQLRKQS